MAFDIANRSIKQNDEASPKPTLNKAELLKTRKAAFKKADKIFLFVIFFACAKKITKRNTLLSLFTQKKKAKKTCRFSIILQIP